MTDKTLKRIEAEAIQFEDKHPFDAIHSAYFMGAKSERNKTIEESIEIISSYRSLDRTQLKEILESLKFIDP